MTWQYPWQPSIYHFHGNHKHFHSNGKQPHFRFHSNYKHFIYSVITGLNQQLFYYANFNYNFYIFFYYATHLYDLIVSMATFNISFPWQPTNPFISMVTINISSLWQLSIFYFLSFASTYVSAAQFHHYDVIQRFSPGVQCEIGFLMLPGVI